MQRYTKLRGTDRIVNKKIFSSWQRCSKLFKEGARDPWGMGGIFFFPGLQVMGIWNALPQCVRGSGSHNF